MIEINLLPGGASRRPAGAARSRGMPKLPAVGGDPRLVGAGAAALLLALLMAYLFWNTGAERTRLEGEIAREVADSTRLASTIALVSQLEARQDTIEQKIDVIRSVDERRYVWPHLMDEISRSLPQYTWLNKVTASEEEPPAAAPAPTDSAAPAPEPVAPMGPRFALEGNTGSTQALTRFMKNLEASPLVRDVSLITSEQADWQGRTLLKFTLEARYEQPDTSIIETVPVVSLR